MTLDEYISIVQQSLEEEGYDSFFPSICIPCADEERLSTLDLPLTENGEEAVAKEWAASMNVQRLYLAYRVGNRKIHVCDIVSSDVADKIEINVEAHSD